MKALILCFLLFLTLPAWAETLTLANGQRCTVLSNGRLGGCTAPTNDRDRSDIRPMARVTPPFQSRRHARLRRGAGRRNINRSGRMRAQDQGVPALREFQALGGLARHKLRRHR